MHAEEEAPEAWRLCRLVTSNLGVTSNKRPLALGLANATCPLMVRFFSCQHLQGPGNTWTLQCSRLHFGNERKGCACAFVLEWMCGHVVLMRNHAGMPPFFILSVLLHLLPAQVLSLDDMKVILMKWSLFSFFKIHSVFNTADISFSFFNLA